MTNVITATDLKRNTAEILNKVAYGDEDIIVKRHGKSLVRLTSAKSKKRKRVVSEAWDKYYGAIPDFPDVTTDRVSKKKQIRL